MSNSPNSDFTRGREATPSKNTHLAATEPRIFSLKETKVGDRVQIVALNGGEANSRLMGMGLMPGTVLDVMSSIATGSVIVALNDHRLGLGAEMAQQIQVIDAEEQATIKQTTPTTPRINIIQASPSNSTVKLRDAAIGATLKVVGYEPTARDYKRKLLAMGLTPGTEFIVKRHAPLGDPTEIEIRHFHLSLRKAEADSLIVEPVSRNQS